MVKLSIIIPYYKTYYLTMKLLRELALQYTKEIEIIVIDDYCKHEFSETLAEGINEILLGKIKFIEHAKNEGVSKSRNDGIKQAKGKYIAFIDSDDMIMPNYVETLLDLINTRKEEIIYFNWIDINTNDVIRHPENCAVWKAIYKKDILPLFDENIIVKEDYYFQQELKPKEHTEYYYDKVLYIYNSNRENSLTWRNKKGEI